MLPSLVATRKSSRQGGGGNDFEAMIGIDGVAPAFGIMLVAIPVGNVVVVVEACKFKN